MPRHKQMPGMTYQVVSQDASQATVEYISALTACRRQRCGPLYLRLITIGWKLAASMTLLPAANAGRHLMFVSGGQ